MKLSLVLVLLVLGFTNVKADEEVKINCDEPGNQHEMNYCAHILYQAEDQILNEVYKKAMTAEFSEDKKINLEHRAKLKESQKAWVGFKTKFCEVQAYYYSSTGSMYALDLYTCLKDQTRAQIKNLELLTK